MIKISQQDNKVLRQIAQAVTPGEIGTAKIKAVLRKMREALKSQADGVALAAPQIGESWRIFIVKEPPLTFINPEIIKTSKKRNLVEEGCLSVRWLYGEVRRAEKVSVEAYDEKGKKFARHASGLLAQIFQHEIDHLDGILFIDKAKNLKEMGPDVK